MRGGQLNGTIIALDLLDFEPIEGVHFIQGDFQDAAVYAQLEAALAAGRSMGGVRHGAESVWHRLDRCRAHLQSRRTGGGLFAPAPQADGALVAKASMARGTANWLNSSRPTSAKVKAVKPKASRDRSAETFLVGVGKKS